MSKNFSNEEIKELSLMLNEMLNEFSDGNDNEYKIGKVLKSRWEECEKGDYDNYEEEDVNRFFECKKILGKDVFKLVINDCEYSLCVKSKDLVLSWINNI